MDSLYTKLPLLANFIKVFLLSAILPSLSLGSVYFSLLPAYFSFIFLCFLPSFCRILPHFSLFLLFSQFCSQENHESGSGGFLTLFCDLYSVVAPQGSAQLYPDSYNLLLSELLHSMLYSACWTHSKRQGSEDPVRRSRSYHIEIPPKIQENWNIGQQIMSSKSRNFHFSWDSEIIKSKTLLVIPLFLALRKEEQIRINACKIFEQVSHLGQRKRTRDPR